MKVFETKFSERLFTRKTELIAISLFLDNIFYEFNSFACKVVELIQRLEKPFTCYSNIVTHKITCSSERSYYK